MHDKGRGSTGAHIPDANVSDSLVPFHQADLGTDTMDEELDESNATRISRELTEIDTALERLYKTPEKFGLCEDTEGEIPFERLDIVPWVRTCN